MRSMKSKIISLPKQTISKNDPFPDKVSLEELRKIWNEGNCYYTDEELMRIREWLYALAEIVLRLTNEKENENKFNVVDLELKQAS